MREPEEVDCCHAWECFGDGGPWGKGAYDDPLSSACGGKPWCECHCMTKEEREELKIESGYHTEVVDQLMRELPMARRCDHCGIAFAEGSVHICKEVDFKENLKRAMRPVEGLKFDDQKPDHSLLPPDALVDIIRVYELGAKRYGRDNWRKGISYSRIFSAIMRHLWAWWKGSDTNSEDAGLKHLAQAAWGVITLLEYTRDSNYSAYDDRIFRRKPMPREEPPQSERDVTTIITPNCLHEYDYDSSWSDTAGLHTRWRCKKCGHQHIVNDPPISIPSVWVGSPWPITFSLTTTEHPEGVTYVYQNGEVVKALSKPEMKTGDGPRPEKRD